MMVSLTVRLLRLMEHSLWIPLTRSYFHTVSHIIRNIIRILYVLYPYLDKDIKTCEDVDECTAKRPCDVNGLCMNTQEWLSCDYHASVDQNKYGRYLNSEPLFLGSIKAERTLRVASCANVTKGIQATVNLRAPNIVLRWRVFV